MFQEFLLSLLARFDRIQKWVLSILDYVLFFKLPHWRMPPGPLANWLPFVGSLPLLVTQQPSYLMMTKISKRYGKIFRLKLGQTEYMVICDEAVLREAFAKQEVSGRRMPPMMDVMDHQGLVHAEGEFWRNQRAFVHDVLRNTGLPRTAELKAFDKKASEAIDDLVDEFKSMNGRPMFVDESVSVTLINIFFSMIVGRKFERDNQRFLAIIESSHESFRKTDPISYGNFVPFFAGLPSNRKILNDMKESKERFIQYMEPIVEDHREKLETQNPKDLIDAFLVQMASEQSCFTKEQLYSLLGDLFTSSLESSAATIHWILLALVNFPLIQEKIYNQICEVTKNERTPNLDDRPNMPYLEATILEGYRFPSVLPIGVPHTATKDTTIDGYHIPKNATVVGLFWNIHHDAKLWKNPEHFDPENHLSNGVLVKHSYLMPFSVGRRMCISDAVANDVIFLIIANLIFKFQFSPADPEAPAINMDQSLPGMVRVPHPFKIKAHLRPPTDHAQQGSSGDNN